VDGKDITAVLDMGCFACSFITLEAAINYDIILTPSNDFNRAPTMILGDGTQKPTLGRTEAITISYGLAQSCTRLVVVEKLIEGVEFILGLPEMTQVGFLNRRLPNPLTEMDSSENTHASNSQDR